MEVGVVAIKGLNSNYYLAISRKGELYGSVSITVRGQSGRSTQSDSVKILQPLSPDKLISTSLLSSKARRVHTHRPPENLSHLLSNV